MTEKTVTLTSSGSVLLWKFRDITNVQHILTRDIDEYYTGAALSELQFQITESRRWIIRARLSEHTGSGGAAMGNDTVQAQLQHMRDTVMSEHDKITLLVTHDDDSTTSVTGTIDSFNLTLMSGRIASQEYTLNFREGDEVWEV